MADEIKVLVTYDLSGKQTPVKEEMKSRKYWDNWIKEGEDVVNYLPSTTLWKKAAGLTPKKVMQDLQDSVKAVNDKRKPGEKLVIIERAKAVKYTSFDGIPGEPYADE